MRLSDTGPTARGTHAIPELNQHTVPVSLASFSVTNYMCFDAWQELELRPITVLIGRNNSGKSALARWPQIAAAGLRTTSTAPIDLDVINTGQSRGGFRDLIYGQRPHGSVGFRLGFELQDNVSANLEVRIQHLDEFQLQVVSHFALSTSNGIEVDIEWDFNEDDVNSTLRYNSKIGGKRAPTPVQFFGILPAYLDPEISGTSSTELSKLLEQMRSSFPAVRYVGPFREQPHRYYQLPSNRPTSVGPIGDQAPAIIADDSFRRKGELTAIINEYLVENLSGWTLGVQNRGDIYSVVLQSGDKTFDVNLADTGTGVAQVLPMLVQRALDQDAPPRSEVIEVIEQPELHLHPSAHAPLADIYLQSAGATPACRFLIETHSETFLLRLRRRIAEGLPSGLVALYYVEHDGVRGSTRRINIDQLGNVDYWPRGIFEEDYEETVALADAQLEAGTNSC